MGTNPPRTNGRDRVFLTLDALIPIVDIAKNACVIPPAQVAFDSVSVLLVMIRVRSLTFYRRRLSSHIFQDSMANEQDYVDLGSTCANVCGVLDRGLNGRQLDELSQSVLEAIQGLTMWAESPHVHHERPLIVLSQLGDGDTRKGSQVRQTQYSISILASQARQG